MISKIDTQNSVGGMLRGATLHLKRFEAVLENNEANGICMDVFKESSSDMRAQINAPLFRRHLIHEQSCYMQELTSEGFLDVI